MLAFLRKYSSLPTATVRFSRGGYVVAVIHPEVSATMWRRARGLMGRTSLAADGGMLFVYPWRRVVRIWMADTPIPLDVVFVEPGGRIAKIATDLAPTSLRWTSSEAPVRWVLEVTAGTVARHGIEVGDRIEINYGE